MPKKIVNAALKAKAWTFKVIAKAVGALRNCAI